MSRIYVCSPYRGNPPYSEEQRVSNLQKARAYCRMVVDEGHTPVAAHLLYADIIDETDLDQRERGLKMGIELLDACDAVWVFGDEMSPGMRAEINYARERNKPVSTRL